jgi:ribonuclease HI
MKNEEQMDGESSTEKRLKQVSKVVTTEMIAPLYKKENYHRHQWLPTCDHEIVYVDGCALNNGLYEARAGIGVYWGENDPRNISEPVNDGPQTNQRAELLSAIRALETMDNYLNHKIEICTDSKYVVSAMTQWRYRWKKNQWKDVLGKELKNKDLWQKLDTLCDRRLHPVIWTHVPGHQGIHGNEMADRLARKGAGSS